MLKLDSHWQKRKVKRRKRTKVHAFVATPTMTSSDTVYSSISRKLPMAGRTSGIQPKPAYGSAILDDCSSSNMSAKWCACSIISAE